MKYIIKRIGRSVEISEATSSLLVYRIPYQNLSVGADEPINFSSLSYFISTLKTKLRVPTALSDMVQLRYLQQI